MLDRKKLLEEVESVYWECFEPNWDAYGAKEVTLDEYDLAREFVALLPDDIAAPSVAAEPSGSITFEWYVGKENTFVVALDEDHTISVAGIGEYAICKKIEWNGPIPEEILALIRKVPEETDSG